MQPKHTLSVVVATAVLLSSIACGPALVGAADSASPVATDSASPVVTDSARLVPGSALPAGASPSIAAPDSPSLAGELPSLAGDGPNATAAPPAGYAADGVDAATAVARHHRAVVASSSVHTELTYEATANGGASVRGVEAWTDFERGVQRAAAQAVYTSAEQYVADGVRYTNLSVSYGDDLRYERSDGGLRANRSTGRDVLARFLPHVEFSLRNVTADDGARLFTYEATGFDAEDFSLYTREVESLRSVNATLVVDDSGRVRSFAFDLVATADDGNPLTVEVSLALDGFGATDVQQPEWVDEEFDEDDVEINGTLV